MKHLHQSQAEINTPGSMQGWGAFYDHLTRFLFFGDEQPVREKCIELANIQPGDRVLEVGCGTGSLSLMAKAKAGERGEVTGIDVAADMLETARRKANQAGLSINFHLGKIENIPSADHSYDVVLSSLMFHHLPGLDEKQRGLAEIYRVLKPGGRLMIMDFEAPKSPLLRVITEHALGHHRAENQNGGLAEMVSKAGFRQVHIVPTRFRMMAFIVGVTSI